MADGRGATQYECYPRREEINTVIAKQARAGLSIKEIVRRADHSRGYVRAMLLGQRSDVFRVRESSLERYLPWLDTRRAAGHRNGDELWRCQRGECFRESLRVVTE